MKKLSRKFIIVISFVVLALAGISFAVYAAVTSTFTKGTVKVSSATVVAAASYTSDTDTFDLTFDEAGKKKNITVKTSNTTTNILQSFYQISIATKDDAEAAVTNDSILWSAILVYFNNEYVGTLKQLTDPISKTIRDENKFVFGDSFKEDVFTFELHQAAKGSAFDNKTVHININTYTENADYSNNIFVKTEADFAKSIDDINCGLLATNPKIVLGASVELKKSYTITNPLILEMNGYNLSGGGIVVNDSDAYVEINGSGSFTSPVTLTSYDAAKAEQIIVDYVENKFASGVTQGSTVTILDHYQFYASKITVAASSNTHGTYTSGSYKAPTTQYSLIDTLSVGSNKLEFEVLGSLESLASSVLAHIPNDENTEISCDLFLPTSIKDSNATIHWTSSNKSIMNDSGRIITDYANKESIELYAEIIVNGHSYTQTFKFKISVFNDEINFYKFVAELSPITLEKIYSGGNDEEALYYLPIYTSNLGNYDYRSSFQTPSDSKLYKWNAYKDIELTNIHYYMTDAQKDEYTYIALNKNASNQYTIALSNTTFNTYAQIKVTGTFGDRSYTTDVNVGISAGSNTQLLEEAFSSIDAALGQVNVLSNMISTRKTSGMYNERGNFTLPASFTDSNDNTYVITYEIPEASQSVLSYVEGNPHTIVVNPENFKSSVSQVAIVAKVTYGSITDQRTYMVELPAAIHSSDLGNVSLFNTIQYQVYLQLPAVEKPANSGSVDNGFETGTFFTNKNYDYILLRDIVGDQEYVSSYYAAGDISKALVYLKKLDYVASDAESYSVASGMNANIALGTKDLYFLTASTNNSSSTDTAAYEFMKLIQWATGTSDAAASTVISNASTVLGANASTKSNKKSYMSDKEIAVLRKYYVYYTGNNAAAEAKWTTLYNSCFEEAPGYIYYDATLLNAVLSCFKTQSLTLYNGSSTSSFSTMYGKYVEVLNRYATSTNRSEQPMAPCQESYNTIRGWMVSNSDLNGTTQSVKYVANATSPTSTVTYSNTNVTISGSYKLTSGKYWNYFDFSNDSSTGKYVGLYATPEYKSDLTAYITENELTVLKVFWLNSLRTVLGTSFNTASKTTIETAMNNGSYSDWTMSSFQTVGTGLLNAFDACMVKPVNFTSNGLADLVEAFYTDSNYHMNQFGQTASSYRVSAINPSTVVESSLTSVSGKTIVNSYIPTTTNLDCLNNNLSWFTKLENVYVYGNSNLYAFQSETGLSIYVTNILRRHSNVETFVTEYAASSAVDYDLSNIKYSTTLKYLSLANNPGITSTNELVNTNRRNYKYVNIQNIGVEQDYAQFAIDNIAYTNGANSCIVYYGTNSYTSTSNDSALADLVDFDNFVAQYLYMINTEVVEGTTTQTVTWRIEEGQSINSSEISTGGYTSLDVAGMNSLVSPYYYCSTSFSYSFGGVSFSFEANNVYKVTYNGSAIVITKFTQNVNSTTTITDSLVSHTVPTISKTPATNTVEQVRTVTSSSSSSKDGGTQIYSANDTTITLKTVSIKVNNKSLQASINNTTYSYFVLLTEANLTNVLSYSGTSYGNQSLSNNTSYYICLVINNTFYYLYKNNTSLGYTTDKNSASILKYNNNKMTTTDNYYLRTSGSTIVFGTNNSNNTFAYTSQNNNNTQSYSWKPYFEATDNSGTKNTYQAAYLGYKKVTTTGVVTTCKEIEKTVYDSTTGGTQYYYYNGSGNITYDGYTIKPGTVIAVTPNYKYPVVTRERTKTENWSTYYYIIFYYKTTSTSTEIELADTITSVKYFTTPSASGTTVTAASVTPSATKTSETAWTDSWSTPLTSTWQWDKMTLKPYISYCLDVNTKAGGVRLDDQISIYTAIKNSRTIVYYCNTAGSESIYAAGLTDPTTKTYSQSCYKLSVSGQVLTWSTQSSTYSSTNTMVTILETANQHFGDNQYGYYYHREYAYSGSTGYYAGIYLEQYTVYRLAPNERNTGFKWEKVKTYTKNVSSGTILEKMGTNQADVDSIWLSNAEAFGHFKSGWYKVIMDNLTNTYNLVKYNDISFTEGTNYTTLKNEKVHAISAGDYLGYSGLFDVEISAVIHTLNADGTYTDQVKRYKLQLVGWLY